MDHPCSICGTRVPLTILVEHLDGCRSTHVQALAQEWSIPDDIAGLFIPGIHDKEKVHHFSSPSTSQGDSAAAASSSSSSSSSLEPWYAAAKNQQHAVSSLTSSCPPELLAASATTTTSHAIIVLPQGPSYLCGEYDAHFICPLLLSPSAAAAAAATTTTTTPPHTPTSPVLYIGSEAAARSTNFLRKHNIVSIVNCAIDSEPLTEEKRLSVGVVGYFHLKIVDAPGAGNHKSLVEGSDAVAEAVKVASASSSSPSSSSSSSTTTTPLPAGVLIHCVAGVSRSVSVAIAYLVRHERKTLREASVCIKTKRKVAYPNIGFWNALRLVEAETHGEGQQSIPEKAFALHKSCPLTALRFKRTDREEEAEKEQQKETVHSVGAGAN